MTKVFVDGSAGTTGLRIHERLAGRNDIELIEIPSAMRKDPASRKEAFQKADIAFLCLPDTAAVEACELARESPVRIIDTSTAHRVDPDWVYGFPEIADFRERIRNARFISNPGCHASGFIALVAPLVSAGILKSDALLSVVSLTGYSGGGRKMIADYEDPSRDELLAAPRAYGLAQTHKHLPEMRLITGLRKSPAFFPIVADFYSGMETIVPVFAENLNGSIEDVRDIYRNLYRGPVVRFCETKGTAETFSFAGLETACGRAPAVAGAGSRFLSAAALEGFDDMKILVEGNSERLSLIALFDNLGKGASGAAIQNMNILMGADETLSLNLSP